jgi:transcriptional repressor NrdR
VYRAFSSIEDFEKEIADLREAMATTEAAERAEAPEESGSPRVAEGK